MKRSRILYLLATALVVALGLASRRFESMLPEFLAAHAGDALWALMVFLGIGFLFPRLSTLRAALAALAFAYAIEISQLYHAEWIDSIRFTMFGRLILGYGFLWADLIRYMAGVLGGVVLEVVWLRRPAAAASAIPSGYTRPEPLVALRAE